VSDLFHDTTIRLLKDLRADHLDVCENVVIEEIRRLPPSPFHIAIELSISNAPADAVAHFDKFFEIESQRMHVAAAYTEMNGFDINPGRWYCDSFAYSAYGGHEDYDWLSDWQSQNFSGFTIRGLESLQAVYAGPAFHQGKFRDVSFMTSLLVVIKFQKYVKAAAAKMNRLHFPLLVSAHDFDFISEITPCK
jgi:hypothetical protein